MICKEDFCAIFKDLHSAERIDLMCGLLQLCVPLELRFLGSHLEELARKDYASLRNFEITSNDLSSLKDASDSDSVDTVNNSWIGALNVYLSLLHSDNTTCAHVLFGVLSRLEHAVEMRVMSKSAAASLPEQDILLTDVDSHTDLVMDLILLFTMAVHHPAFTYSQRQQLYNSCKKIEKLLNYVPTYKVGILSCDSVGFCYKRYLIEKDASLFKKNFARGLPVSLNTTSAPSANSLC